MAPRQLRVALIIAGALLLVILTCNAPLLPRALQSAAAPEPTAAPAAATIQEPAPSQAPFLPFLPALPTVTPLSTATPQPTAAPTAMPGSAPDAPPLDPLGREIDTYLSGLVANNLFQGVVLVARNGKAVIARAYGNADAGVANTVETRFRLASLTKQFTAAAILSLQNEGKLAVDDTICNYLDPCADVWKPITIRQLLNHTSGIVDYTDFASFEPTEMNPTTPQELVERFRNQPLGFAPGTLYDYCNSNYVLLGLVIERVSGQSYADYLQQRFFEPLGMSGTGYDTNRGAIVDGAQGYFTPAQKTGFLDASTLYAAGGLYSTAGDLFRWDQALTNETALPRAQLDQMFTPAILGYGFGWKIEMPGGIKRISHAGNMTGVANFYARYPDEGVTVIVLANMQYANAEGIADYIASRVFASP